MPLCLTSCSASRQHHGDLRQPEGTLVYLRTADDNDALAYVGRDGRSITESPIEILTAAQCHPDTPAHPRHEEHHQLVAAGAKHISQQASVTSVGNWVGPAARVTERTTVSRSMPRGSKANCLTAKTCDNAINDIYRYHLRQAATDTLNRQMRSGIDDAWPS